MLFFGFCASLIQGVCFAVYLLLFGRLTGAFTLLSFANHCDEKQNSETTHAGSSFRVNSAFRDSVMSNVHWLLSKWERGLLG